MTVTGPVFVALQVRDVERAATFYEAHLGLKRADHSPPGGVLFQTEPIPFAVREPLPDVDLDTVSPRPGVGIRLWLTCDDPDALCAQMVAAGVHVPEPPEDGPFGRVFSFIDLDGYLLTVRARPRP